jgi:hypothetical protein
MLRRSLDLTSGKTPHGNCSNGFLGSLDFVSVWDSLRMTKSFVYIGFCWEFFGSRATSIVGKLAVLNINAFNVGLPLGSSIDP